MHAFLQVDAAVADSLARIALAQTIIAAGASVLFIVMLIGAVISFRTLRSTGRLLRRLEHIAEEIVPRIEPLIESASRVADDANDVSDSLRRKVHELTGTLEELNTSVRRASRSAQRRARDFAAVVDVVQQEAEALLLDAAATARGVHTTAETLRGAGQGRAARVPRQRHDDALSIHEEPEVP